MASVCMRVSIRIMGLGAIAIRRRRIRGFVVGRGIGCRGRRFIMREGMGKF
jgi:hypothetical protein